MLLTPKVIVRKKGFFPTIEGKTNVRSVFFTLQAKKKITELMKLTVTSLMILNGGKPILSNKKWFMSAFELMTTSTPKAQTN
jgi:hypothetical protein